MIGPFFGVAFHRIFDDALFSTPGGTAGVVTEASRVRFTFLASLLSLAHIVSLLEAFSRAKILVGLYRHELSRADLARFGNTHDA